MAGQSAAASLGQWMSFQQEGISGGPLKQRNGLYNAIRPKIGGFEMKLLNLIWKS